MTDLQVAVRALIESAGGVSAVSLRCGLGRQHVYKMASGRSGASPEMCRKLGIPERLATNDAASRARNGGIASGAARALDPEAVPIAETERERIAAIVAADETARSLLIRRSRPLRTPKPPTVGELVRDVLRAERRLRAWAADRSARAGEVAGG